MLAHEGYFKPTQIPGGRLEVDLESELYAAELDIHQSVLKVRLSSGRCLKIQVSQQDDAVFVEGSLLNFKLIPAWGWNHKKMSAAGLEPPVMLCKDAQETGFIQHLPSGDSLKIECDRYDSGLRIEVCSSSSKRTSYTTGWLNQYWSSAPRVLLPDSKLQNFWDYCLYKQAVLNPVHAPPATLTGPWMAETEMPLWGNDYHFNINLQMIYWPLLACGQSARLWPLWRMIQSWMPIMKKNGEQFYGVPGAMLLPSAVDDQGHAIGSYWQGTVDQACLAWVGYLAWLHYRYSADIEVVRQVAQPLLSGAFEGFWAMSKLGRDGVLSLTFSVSPEFGNGGKNSSYYLAAFHLTTRLLESCSQLLGLGSDKRWQLVKKALPKYCTTNFLPLRFVCNPKSTLSSLKLLISWGLNILFSDKYLKMQESLTKRIVLWEGQDLLESHRHHSHLAGIYPFCTVDPQSDPDRQIVKNTLEHWMALGTGYWTGWSFAWAAAIWARCNCATTAVSFLNILHEVFTNDGKNTLLSADAPGICAHYNGGLLVGQENSRKTDDMQLDAAFGFLQGVMEIFVQQRGEWLYVLPSLPKQWPDFQFENVHCEGAFVVDGFVRDARVREIRVRSKKGGRLKLVLPTPMKLGSALVERYDEETAEGDELVFSTE